MKSSRLALWMIVLSLLPTGVWNQPAKGPQAATTNNDEAEIKALLDRWAKAFEAHDIDGIMSIYASGDAVIAYDVVPPLQYKGKEAYRKDYLRVSCPVRWHRSRRVPRYADPVQWRYRVCPRT